MKTCDYCCTDCYAYCFTCDTNLCKGHEHLGCYCGGEGMEGDVAMWTIVSENNSDDNTSGVTIVPSATPKGNKRKSRAPDIDGVGGSGRNGEKAKGLKHTKSGSGDEEGKTGVTHFARSLSFSGADRMLTEDDQLGHQVANGMKQVDEVQTIIVFDKDWLEQYRRGDDVGSSCPFTITSLLKTGNSGIRMTVSNAEGQEGIVVDTPENVAKLIKIRCEDEPCFSALKNGCEVLGGELREFAQTFANNPKELLKMQDGCASDQKFVDHRTIQRVINKSKKIAKRLSSVPNVGKFCEPSTRNQGTPSQQGSPGTFELKPKEQKVSFFARRKKDHSNLYIHLVVNQKDFCQRTESSLSFGGNVFVWGILIECGRSALKDRKARKEAKKVEAEAAVGSNDLELKKENEKLKKENVELKKENVELKESLGKSEESNDLLMKTLKTKLSTEE